MLIDLTLKVTPKMVVDAQGNETKSFVGHLGTHFDVMDKEFPLEYVERKGIVFDVHQVGNGEVGIDDVDLAKVEKDMFVGFYSGFIERVEYGSREYLREHPQLSPDLVEALVAKDISIIGVDFTGVRRGREHTATDRYCADRGVFIVENLCNFQPVVQGGGIFTACTYPMHFAEMTGLPCRVVAKL